jgi:hypothetical protein
MNKRNLPPHLKRRVGLAHLTFMPHLAYTLHQEESAMASIIKDSKSVKAFGTVKLDAKKRISLPKSVLTDDVIYYQVYHNKLGQIILDPQVQIPTSELWLYSPAVLKELDKALANVAKGKVSKVKRSDL